MSQDKLHPDAVDMLTVGKGDTARDIAYSSNKGDGKGPGLFWLSGLKSSMHGQKAVAMAEWAEEQGRACCRFDYSGHGLSNGIFDECTVSDWLEEALTVFNAKTDGPQILIGSSMGGWLALLLAKHPSVATRLAGVVLIAPAWDMTEKLMWQRFDENAKKSIETKGYFPRSSTYGDGDYIITKELIEDGRNHLLEGELLLLGCPVHILHGRNDADVPWQHGHDLTRLLPHDEVIFTLVPDGDHRLSRAEDIALLIKTVEALSDSSG